MRKFLTAAATAAVALAATPASAVTFIVTWTSANPPIAVPAGDTTVPIDVTQGNDFFNDLSALGLTQYVAAGASITLIGQFGVDFRYMGAESGNKNKFTAGPVSGFESGGGNAGSLDNNFGTGGDAFAPQTAGSFNTATFNPFFTNPSAVNHGVGTAEFGIFIDPSKVVMTAPGVFTYSSRTLLFGYDDNGAGPDDNHDDFIVSAAAIPEPATWAMMIGGFGLVGASMRRRGSQRIVTA